MGAGASSVRKVVMIAWYLRLCVVGILGSCRSRREYMLGTTSMARRGCWNLNRGVKEKRLLSIPFLVMMGPNWRYLLEGSSYWEHGDGHGGVGGGQGLSGGQDVFLFAASCG